MNVREKLGYLLKCHIHDNVPWIRFEHYTYALRSSPSLSLLGHLWLPASQCSVSCEPSLKWVTSVPTRQWLLNHRSVNVKENHSRPTCLIALPADPLAVLVVWVPFLQRFLVLEPAVLPMWSLIRSKEEAGKVAKTENLQEPSASVPSRLLTSLPTTPVM